MQEIEAMEATKGDASTGNVVYIAAHEHTGQWVDTKFVIIGAYQCFQSANHHIMKYFSELGIQLTRTYGKVKRRIQILVALLTTKHGRPVGMDV